jgi:ABC-type multidrug transport system fused ATPase/permease subunit
MVNKYINTKEIVKEYQKAWWSDKYKKEIIIMCIVLLMGLFMLTTQIIKKDIKTMSLIAFIVLPIMYFGMYFYKKKRAFKLEEERFDQLYKDVKNREINIRFDNLIKVTTTKNTTEVSYDKIKKYVDTKNLIVLLLKENTTIALKKDSFVNGTEEEFKKLLNEKLKK